MTSKQQLTAMEREVIAEKIKQIVYNHFYLVYVKRNIDAAFECIHENCHWMGSKEHYVAQNKESHKIMLESELEEIPCGCVIKTDYMDVCFINKDFCSVTGEIELRLPYDLHVSYIKLRFSAVLGLYGDEYKITSLHTSRKRDGIVMGGNISEIKGVRNIVNDLKNTDKYDPLTGLYTLDLFKQEVGKILKEEADNDSKYVLLCTDIENFEKVNNLYGLRRADRILSSLANLMTSFDKHIKASCRSVADHFVVLVKYENEDVLKNQLEECCKYFTKNITENYSEALPRLGIGVYEIFDKTENIGKMIEFANIARKALKINKNKNVIFYDNKIFHKIEKVKQIEKEMRPALERGEFRVFLQPKYNLKSEKIVGAEALCRWIRDDGSMVYPDEFIPVFEENGFIEEIDFYMLSSVCEMIENRKNEGKLCVPISINQSRMLLRDENYVEKISKIITKYDIDFELLEFELTERIFQDDLTEFAQVMNEIKNFGIKWSIDDFGTGYSSLNLLKELPVDIIKIDKTFLDEAGSSEASKIIIRKTVELTQELDKHVICEGVETQEQAQYLRNISCDMAQGFLYAKPMPILDFEGMLDDDQEI